MNARSPVELLCSSHDYVDHLNSRFAGADARTLLRACLGELFPGRVALVSSFGVEAAATLGLLSEIDAATPVLFLETGKHFPETLEYVEQLETALGLQDLRILRPDRHALRSGDPFGILNATDPDRCCHLRKVAPLEAALTGFDAWVTGRKRSHGGDRAGLQLFDLDRRGRVRINPLCHWGTEDVEHYLDARSIPRHPLAQRGYRSVGCAPCTAPATDSRDPRAGRWAGSCKTECGIHLA